MRIEFKIYSELKHKDIFTQEQARMLLIALQEAFKKNEELAQHLEKAIREVNELSSRLQWYRNITINQVGDD